MPQNALKNALISTSIFSSFTMHPSQQSHLCYKTKSFECFCPLPCDEFGVMPFKAIPTEFLSCLLGCPASMMDKG